MKRFVFRWLYRLSWVLAAIGLLLMAPTICLESYVDKKDRL